MLLVVTAVFAAVLAVIRHADGDAPEPCARAGRQVAVSATTGRARHVGPDATCRGALTSAAFVSALRRCLLLHRTSLLGEEARSNLDTVHRAREEALARCRETIRACGFSIRAVHRLNRSEADARAGEAEAALRRAQELLLPFPSLAAAGFLHDAEKEYAEARLTASLTAGEQLPDAQDLGVGLAAWLNGLAEAASELRRHLLDRLRQGDVARGEELLVVMEDVFEMLVTIEYPDAITGGLRRAVDALRAVLERSRSDVTTTVLQVGLQRTIEAHSGPSGS